MIYVRNDENLSLCVCLRQGVKGVCLCLCCACVFGYLAPGCMKHHTSITLHNRYKDLIESGKQSMTEQAHSQDRV